MTVDFDSLDEDQREQFSSDAATAQACAYFHGAQRNLRRLLACIATGGSAALRAASEVGITWQHFSEFDDLLTVYQFCDGAAERGIENRSAISQGIALAMIRWGWWCPNRLDRSIAGRIDGPGPLAALFWAMPVDAARKHVRQLARETFFWGCK
jgi:hypothetical protein